MKVDDGTGDVSSGRQYRTVVMKGISRKVKSQKRPDEKSEEAIVARKAGNAAGAKGLYLSRAFEEGGTA